MSEGQGAATEGRGSRAPGGSGWVVAVVVGISIITKAGGCSGSSARHREEMARAWSGGYASKEDREILSLCGAWLNANRDQAARTVSRILETKGAIVIDPRAVVFERESGSVWSGEYYRSVKYRVHPRRDVDVNFYMTIAGDVAGERYVQEAWIADVRVGGKSIMLEGRRVVPVVVFRDEMLDVRLKAKWADALGVGGSRAAPGEGGGDTAKPASQPGGR